jgi:hypothetical protein
MAAIVYNDSMNADQLAVERAAWAVALKQEFKFLPDFQYREHFNDYQTIFVVTRADTPGWKSCITICSAHRMRNRIEIDGVVVAHSGKTSSRHKVMDTIQRLWEHCDKGLKAKESAAATWQKRQETELAGLKELPGLDVEIIKAGPHAGRYEVRLLPGNALEHLTLEQFKDFYALCCRFNPKA